MQIPAAGFIEAAHEMLKNGTIPAPQLLAQADEMRAATGVLSGMFMDGYQLGLATARVMIATNVALLRSGVNPEDVL